MGQLRDIRAKRLPALARRTGITGAFGLAAATLVFVTPGPASNATGIATILAVSIIALAAGHKWALALLALGQLGLAATLLPPVASSLEAGSASALAVGALLACIPGILICLFRAPMVLGHLAGQPDRPAAGLAPHAASIAALLWLGVPTYAGLGNPVEGRGESIAQTGERHPNPSVAISSRVEPEGVAASLTQSGEGKPYFTALARNLTDHLTHIANNKPTGGLAEQQLIGPQRSTWQAELDPDPTQ